MSKQKLAQMVLQKMQEKKERDERNRPHREVLQLLVKFEVQDYTSLSSQITELNKEIQIEEKRLEQLSLSNAELENTGKKQYPRIIVKPEFIASGHVLSEIKEYYRKASNTFLRADLLRKSSYKIEVQYFAQLKQTLKEIKMKQQKEREQKEYDQKILNEKRLRNLKEDLRFRHLKEEQNGVSQKIEEDRQKFKDLIAQYDLKKNNLHKREEWASRLVGLIEQQKNTIQKAYNPVTYREYLKKIFFIRTKNQLIQKNLIEATKVLQTVQTEKQKRNFFLEKNDHLFIQGKCSNSPSKKKRCSVGSISQEKPKTLKISNLLSSLKNSILSETVKSQPRSRTKSKNKSISTSIGKTTASSIKNLFDFGSKQQHSSSFTAQFKKSKSLFKTGKLF